MINGMINGMIVSLAILNGNMQITLEPYYNTVTYSMNSAMTRLLHVCLDVFE